MNQIVHLTKLAAGIRQPVELRTRQQSNLALSRIDGAGNVVRVPTKSRPKREDELLSGGSLYWIFAGAIQCRQRILRLEEVIDSEGKKRCLIHLDPEIVMTEKVLRKPFQGWRYLADDLAPRDLGALDMQGGSSNDLDEMPIEMRRELAAMGVL